VAVAGQSDLDLLPLGAGNVFGFYQTAESWAVCASVRDGKHHFIKPETRSCGFFDGSPPRPKPGGSENVEFPHSSSSPACHCYSFYCLLAVHVLPKPNRKNCHHKCLIYNVQSWQGQQGKS